MANVVAVGAGQVLCHGNYPDIHLSLGSRDRKKSSFKVRWTVELSYSFSHNGFPYLVRRDQHRMVAGSYMSGYTLVIKAGGEPHS